MPARTPAPLTPARPLGSASRPARPSPRPAQPATGNRTGAGRAQEIPPLPGLRGAGGGGRGRRGPLDPRSCSRSPRALRLPGPRPQRRPRAPGGGVGLGWGQEGWNPPLGLALRTDRQPNPTGQWTSNDAFLHVGSTKMVLREVGSAAALPSDLNRHELQVCSPHRRLDF